MPSDKVVRGSAFAFAIFFVVVVAMGYIPGLNATPHVHNPDAMAAMPMPSDSLAPGEHTMLGLYKISLQDDVTHGISAIAFLIAALVSARWSRLVLTAFGWYYAYDATIYLVTGILQKKPFMQNFGLNAPHVGISSVMLYLAYRGRTSVPTSSIGTQR
ncbi:MAG: hypothetical protein ACO1Q7_11045 [Gemmatimonas sp.]